MKGIKVFSIALVGFFLTTTFAAAQEALKPVKLPPAQTQGGKPLMQALRERKSTREYGQKDIPAQALSDLLWAAFGINRPETAGRTAPSTMDFQEIDIYVAKKEGLYLYDAQKNELELVIAKDLREATGKQPFVKEAPVNLVYVADVTKMSKSPADSIDRYAAADAAFISQNVYLFCASSGMATVVRDWVDKPALAGLMGLKTTQRIVFAQTVGYPKE